MKEGSAQSEWSGNGKREIEEKTIFNFRDSIILRDGHSRLLSFSESSVLLLKTQLNYWDLGQKWVCPKFFGELFGSFQTDVDLNYTVIPIMQIDLWPTFEILTYYFILNAFFAVNLEELWKTIWEINDWKCLDLFLFEISVIAVMLDNISCHLSQKLSHKHSCRLFV